MTSTPTSGRPDPARPGETWKSYMGRMTAAYLRIPEIPPKPKKRKRKTK